jgi:hypothetical protein
MIAKETTYGTYVTPTETITEGIVFLPGNFTGKTMIRDAPIGFSQPIKHIWTDEKPDFEMSWYTIGGYFWNFLLGADFTGTADEDIDGAQAGHTCYKFRIPSTTPFRPEPFSMELAEEAGASDNLLKFQGNCINSVALTIPKAERWEFRGRVLAQHCAIATAAKQTATFSEAIPFLGRNTEFKIGGGEELGFTRLTLNVNNNLMHSGDITGDGYSSDLIRRDPGLQVGLDVDFLADKWDFISDLVDETSVGDIEIRQVVGDTPQRKMNILLKDCAPEKVDFGVERGNKQVIHKVTWVPRFASSTDMIQANYSTLTSGGIHVW